MEKLMRSIAEDPELMQARPLIVNDRMEVLAGNQRLRACIALEWPTVPCVVVDWDEAKQRRAMIKDNVSAGEWDQDMLANEWDAEDLDDWGLKVWQPEDQIDMSILDEIDESRALDMTDNVRKAIQVFFEAEDYEEAKNLWSKINKAQVYAGRHIIEAMKKAYEQD